MGWEGISLSPRQTSDSFVASKAKRKYKKKTLKVGAGMELHYQKEMPEIQAQLQETMKKEWSNCMGTLLRWKVDHPS